MFYHFDLLSDKLEGFQKLWKIEILIDVLIAIIIVLILMRATIVQRILLWLKLSTSQLPKIFFWNALVFPTAFRILPSLLDVRCIETCSTGGKSPTQELIWSWAQQNKTVGDLLKVLDQMGHVRARSLFFQSQGEAIIIHFFTIYVALLKQFLYQNMLIKKELALCLHATTIISCD